MTKGKCSSATNSRVHVTNIGDTPEDHGTTGLLFYFFFYDLFI